MKNVIATNIINATIEASSENPIMLFSDALIDSRLSRKGQTLSKLAQWVLFSFDAAVDVDVVAILENNFTSSATVKIQANATDIWTSPSIDQILTYTKDDRRSLELGTDVGIWSYQFGSTESYKYWRIYVDDSSNANDYIEFSFAFLDEETIFPGMSVNQVFTRNTTSEPNFSVSGQIYGLKRTQYNAVSFNFPTITEAEKTTLDLFYDAVDIVTPYLMLVWENSLDVQKPLYVVNLTLPEWSRSEMAGGILWSSNLEIREVY